ncbi:hypothetical protein [Lachnoclostridium sp. An138]|uniref:hypothetical protein n=1 Tax=Lachnoclostridium sp. An138 TaxID=1965560 RepID=UPI000B39CA40|nr:hypothetical protein [Lachnoclostridium sp. An138]OUQ16593.1 hypothetical protein B5E82_13180 [Lachnoclostridium sp. An138]
MTAVLAGFLLVLLHLKEEGLELFLKLAGYILIAGGLTGFLKESVIFARARKGAVVLAVCAGILWLGSLYELSLSGPAATVFGWLVTAGDMYIRYMTVAGIQDMEQAGNEEFYSKELFQVWKIWTATLLFILLMLFISSEFTMFLASAAGVVYLACVVIFLIYLDRSRAAYLNYVKEREASLR